MTDAEYAARFRYTTTEAAQLLGISAGHVVTLIDAGLIQALDVRGPDAKTPTYRLAADGLADFIEKRLTVRQ